MEIEQFIQKYDIKKIKNLEQNDPQFLALKNARNKIKNKDKNLFLYLTIQCSLVGYQIAGSGESRWGEFGEKITQDRQILQNLRNQKKCNSSRWYSFLTSSKYNKRIYNIKTNRIKKFNQILIEENNFSNFGNKLQKLNTILATTMKSKKDNKTITFAVKMFGYAHEVISGKEIIYPMNISIPIDSRLKKIYTTNYPIRGKDQLAGRGVQNKEIKTYFQKLSETHKIPPLHLDSILRLDYWNKFFKK